MPDHHPVLATLLLAASLAGAQEPRPYAAPAAVPPGGCEPIQGIEPVLKQGTILLLGELHGTAESPAFAGEVACHALAAGLDVTVGLELPQADQSRLESYLASRGDARARREFLESPFWNKLYQDGRTSMAMMDLLERVRRLGAGRRGPARVVFYDRTDRRGDARDRAMAEKLAQSIHASPNDLLVVLSGNVHNRTRRGTPWDDDYEPMGYALSRMFPEARILALDVSSRGGTAWTCTGGGPESCQVRPVGGDGEGERPAIWLREGADAAGFHGRYFVGDLSASLPAAGPLAPPEPEPAPPPEPQAAPSTGRP